MSTVGLAFRSVRQISPRFVRNASSSTAQRPARTFVYATALALSAGAFAVYYSDARSAIHRYFFTPLIRHTLDAETGQKFALKVLRSGLSPFDPLPDQERLRVTVSRTSFSADKSDLW